ncbi:hypothetical protein ES705_41242 [subsurface metagenome]
MLPLDNLWLFLILYLNLSNFYHFVVLLSQILVLTYHSKIHLSQMLSAHLWHHLLPLPQLYNDVL